MVNIVLAHDARFHDARSAPIESGMLTKILVPPKFNPGSQEPRFAGRFDEQTTVSIWNCAKKIEFLFLVNVKYDFYHRGNLKPSIFKVTFCGHGGMTVIPRLSPPQTSSALFRFFAESDTSCPIFRVKIQNRRSHPPPPTPPDSTTPRSKKEISLTADLTSTRQGGYLQRRGIARCHSIQFHHLLHLRSAS
jgi:hypothetical protein